MKRAATTVPEGTDSLYERDFHAWTRRTAKLLRAGRVEEGDLDRAAGEIEDMGTRDAKELDGRMQILLARLARERFPRACPFRVEQLLDEEFLPE